MKDNNSNLVSKQQNFLHGAVIIMFGTFMAKFLGIFFRLLLGNTIGAEGVGYYSTAYSIYRPLYAVSVSGLPVALAKLVAENAEKKRTVEVKKIFNIAYLLFMVVGIVLMLIMLIFSKNFSIFMHNPGARFGIAALAPVAFFCCLSGAYKGYYEGLRNMYPTAVSEIVEAISKLFFGLIFVYIGLKIGASQYLKTGTVFGLAANNIEEAKCMLGAAGAVCGIAVSSMIGTLFLNFCYKSQKSKNKIIRKNNSIKANYKILSLILSTAIPIFLSSIIFNISGQIDARTAKIGLEHAIRSHPDYFKRLINPIGHEVKDVSNFLWGDYGLILPIYNFLPAMMVSFGVSLLPNLAAAWSIGNRLGVKKYIESSLRITNTLVFLIGGVVVSNARNILFLIYSKKAADIELAVPSLKILGICIIFSALASSTNIILQAIGRARVPVILMTCGVIIKYNVNKILVRVPYINIKGAAIGTFCCYAFIAVAGLKLVFKITRVKINVNSVFIKPFIAGLFVFISGIVVEKISGFFMPSFAALKCFLSFVSLCIVGIICLFSISFFKVVKQEDLISFPNGRKIVSFLKKFNMV